MDLEEEISSVPISFTSDGSLYHQNALNSGAKHKSAATKQPSAQRPAAKLINLNQKVVKPNPAPAAEKPKPQAV